MYQLGGAPGSARTSTDQLTRAGSTSALDTVSGEFSLNVFVFI